jgi:hypothetical protein
VIKDVVMVGGYQEAEVDSVADWSDSVPLPSAVAHGFRVYDAPWLRLSEKRIGWRSRQREDLLGISPGNIDTRSPVVDPNWVDCDACGCAGSNG